MDMEVLDVMSWLIEESKNPETCFDHHWLTGDAKLMVVAGR